MNKSTVFAKTAKGQEEAATRQHKLSVRQRTVLIMVNGTDPVSALAHKFPDANQLTELLTELHAGGFIAEAADRRQAMRSVVRQVHELLGPDGDGVAERIEELAEGPDGHVAVAKFLTERREMFDDIAGKEKAAAFYLELATLLR
jgi:hypothetical protein